MVKGNKFKPGEPPHKRQKTALAAVALQQQDQCANGVGSSKPATFLEVIMASRPAKLNSSIPDVPPSNQAETLLADGNAKSSASGRLSQKKRQREKRSLDVASKRQKADLPEDLSGIKSNGKVKEAEKVQMPLAGKRSHKGGGKKKKASQMAAKLGLDKAAVPEQKPALKPTANQRKKARKRARQRLSSEEALITSGQQEDKDSSGVRGDKDVAAIEEGIQRSSLPTKEHPKQAFKAKEVGTHQVIQTSRTQSGRGTNLPKDTTTLAPPSKGAPLSSNWASLKPLIGAGKKVDAQIKGSTPKEAAEAKRPEPTGNSREASKCVAVDCEMVGVGPHGIRSSLARVSIVNDQGNVLMDKFVRQKERVTDYRTRYSGIRPEDVTGSKAEPFAVVQKEAADIFKGRVLVGHAIQNDLKALLLSHPVKLIRDTARYPPLMRPAQPGRKPKPRALRHLAFEELGLGIQEGEHSPVEDARSALYLYQKNAKVWEQHLQRGTFHLLKAPGTIPEEAKKGSGKTLAQYAAKDVMVDL